MVDAPIASVGAYAEVVTVALVAADVVVAVTVAPVGAVPYALTALTLKS